MPPHLRTLTGCLNCRERRKKCDERKPVCGACNRREARCRWPTTSRVDGRRLRRAVPAEIRSPDCSSDPHRLPQPSAALSLASASADAIVVDADWLPPHREIMVGQDFLYQYCFKIFLPSQYHQPGFSAVTNISYLASMCLKSSFLRNAVMACAMVQIKTDMDAWQAMAQKHYLAAVGETSSKIAGGELDGTEDELLAAVIWLCVFENSMLDVGYQSEVHIKGVFRLLSLRVPKDRTMSPLGALDWERTCVESFIYHTGVISLYKGESHLINEARQVLAKYKACLCPITQSTDFDALDQHVFRSPVLGAPYDIFFSLLYGTKLLRAAQPLSIGEEMATWSRYYKTREWQARLDEACRNPKNPPVWMGKPYAIAVRIILLHVLLDVDTAKDSALRELGETANEATALLHHLGDYLHRTWGKYLLWPLAVLGATATDQEDIDCVRRLLGRIFQRSNSSTVIPIKQILEEKIWARTREPDQDSLALSAQGLCIIVNEKLVAGEAAQLLKQQQTSVMSLSSKFWASVSL